MSNARVLKEGLEKMGRFEIISKDVGVPLVAFSLKNSSKHTVFEISESLRRYGWIVPAYTMPPDAEEVAVLRAVIREDFSRSLAERLTSDIEKVLKQIEALPPRISTRAAHLISTRDAHLIGSVSDTPVATEELERSVRESQSQVAMECRNAGREKVSGVC